MVGDAALIAVWLAVALVEAAVVVCTRGAVAVVEMVSAALDWVGAEY